MLGANPLTLSFMACPVTGPERDVMDVECDDDNSGVT
jgi:hypothetical protein